MANRRLIGERLRDAGVVDARAVLRGLEIQRRSRRLLGRRLPLGEILVMEGALSLKDLRVHLEAPDAYAEPAERRGSLLFGAVAAKRGLATERQVLDALDRQLEGDARGEPHRRIGEILVARGALAPAQVEAILEALAEEEEARL